MSTAQELPKAAAKGDVKTVRRLLSGGTPPNTKGAHGATALVRKCCGPLDWVVSLLAPDNLHVGAGVRWSSRLALPASVGCVLVYCCTAWLPGPKPALSALPVARPPVLVHVLCMSLASVSSTHQGLAAPRLPHMQHFAAEGGHAAVIAALLKGKATVDAKTMGGLTPLHKAAEAGRPEAVAALLEGGASPDVQASPPSSSMRCVLVVTPWRRWIAGMFNLIPCPALLFPSWLVADCYAQPLLRSTRSLKRLSAP